MPSFHRWENQGSEGRASFLSIPLPQSVFSKVSLMPEFMGCVCGSPWSLPSSTSPSLWVGASPGASGSIPTKSAALGRRTYHEEESWELPLRWFGQKEGGQLLLSLPCISSLHRAQTRALLVCQVAFGPSWFLLPWPWLLQWVHLPFSV